MFEHLADHGALHFSFGLLEMPVFELPNGARLATPRILARTAVNVGEVVQIPEGYGLKPHTSNDKGDIDPETQVVGDDRQVVWRSFLQTLDLDDPEQPVPRASRQGFLKFILPAPGGTSWITAYRDSTKREVGLFLSFTRGSIGQRATNKIAGEAEQEMLRDLGGDAFMTDWNETRTFADKKHFCSLSDPAVQERALSWLAVRTNDFVNVLRPAMRSAILDI